MKVLLIWSAFGEFANTESRFCYKAPTSVLLTSAWCETGSRSGGTLEASWEQDGYAVTQKNSVPKIVK